MSISANAANQTSGKKHKPDPLNLDEIKRACDRFLRDRDPAWAKNRAEFEAALARRKARNADA
jgi:hypothetical protein